MRAISWFSPEKLSAANSHMQELSFVLPALQEPK